jgi:hypothetical protein
MDVEKSSLEKEIKNSRRATPIVFIHIREKTLPTVRKSCNPLIDDYCGNKPCVDVLSGKYARMCV